MRADAGEHIVTNVSCSIAFGKDCMYPQPTHSIHAHSGKKAPWNSTHARVTVHKKPSPLQRVLCQQCDRSSSGSCLRFWLCSRSGAHCGPVWSCWYESSWHTVGSSSRVCVFFQTHIQSRWILVVGRPHV